MSDEEQKKSGRKPKNSENATEPKKRGRKPKNKNAAEADPVEKKVPKKRGRKPKDTIYNIKQIDQIIIQDNENDNIILHLPISSSDILDGDELTKYNPDMKIPEPYEKEDHSYELIEGNKVMKNDVNMEKESYIETEEVREIEVNIGSVKNTTMNDEKVNLNMVNNICDKKLKNIQYEFIDANTKKIWPSCTQIYCMWCCHKFDTVPISVPHKYQNDTFFVSGNYCSFNCAASYIFNKNDDFMWKHYNLLNLLYKKISNNEPKKIKLAPPKEVLQIFGGYMSIEEYRTELMVGNKDFKLIEPPLVSIVPKIEETCFKMNDGHNVNKKLYIPLDGDLVDKAKVSMKLKREKPILQDKSTLHNFMNLQIV